MSDWQACVRDFHHEFGVHVGKTPELREPELRAKLISAVTWGVDLEPIFQRVHASNMTKTGGVRDDGKILKGEGFVAPDVAGELERQGWQP